MNVLSRRLYQLENNILEFPPEDDDILIHVGNRDELLLHDRAQKIRDTVKDEAQAIVESGKNLEQQNEAAKQLLSRLTDEQNGILDQSHEFLTYRMERLVYKWFAAAYPKGEDQRVMLRVMWFFSEMQKFNNSCLIEDFEWNNNRNEDDPDFDDNAWWGAVEAKINALFREGVFTEKSFEAFERLYDELISRKIKEFYDLHPEKWEALVNNLNKETEEGEEE